MTVGKRSEWTAAETEIEICVERWRARRAGEQVGDILLADEQPAKLHTTRLPAVHRRCGGEGSGDHAIETAQALDQRVVRVVGGAVEQASTVRHQRSGSSGSTPNSCS